MGVKRLPRDPEGQRSWARTLALKARPLPLALFRGSSRAGIGSYYPTMFRSIYQAGAQAALEEVLREIERSDDPYQGLPPHLVKSAKAAAAARRRKRDSAQPARPARARSQRISHAREAAA